MIIFFETEHSILITDIERLEIYTDLNFPVEYSQHLLQNNGGYCEPNVFSFNERGKFTESLVHRFLAIYEGEYDNLRDYIQTYKINDKRIPRQMLPIAHDPGGNLICISCGDKDYGAIYFWDHEREVNYNLSNDDDYSNLYLVAPSFNTFLEGLKEE